MEIEITKVVFSTDEDRIEFHTADSGVWCYPGFAKEHLALHGPHGTGDEPEIVEFEIDRDRKQAIRSAKQLAFLEHAPREIAVSVELSE